MPWNEFVRKRIFEPLQMSRSATTFAEWNAAKDRASGHRYDPKTGTVTVRTIIDEDNLGPAGTIASCARDMAQWLRFHLANGTIDGKRLVSAEALGETKTPQTLIRLDHSARELNPDANLLAYGMGWNVSDYHGSTLITHAGALNGFRAQIALLPNEHAGVVVMTNAGRGIGVLALRAALIDQLLGRAPRDWNAYYLATEKKLDDEDEKTKRDRDAKRHRDTHPSRDLAAYAGTYVSPAYGPAMVTLENGALVLHWRQLRLPLAHFHFDTFSAVSEEDEVDEQVEFKLGADGEVKTLTIFGETFTRP
jgi:CubicO group peptidase (beta-lactamase class C family)